MSTKDGTKGAIARTSPELTSVSVEFFNEPVVLTREKQAKTSTAMRCSISADLAQ